MRKKNCYRFFVFILRSIECIIMNLVIMCVRKEGNWKILHTLWGIKAVLWGEKSGRKFLWRNLIGKWKQIFAFPICLQDKIFCLLLNSSIKERSILNVNVGTRMRKRRMNMIQSKYRNETIRKVRWIFLISCMHWKRI